MILNHKRAIEYITALSTEKSITSHEICSMHALLSENLLGDPSASGRLRNIAVGISATSYLPVNNPHILKACFDMFIEKFNLIEDPFEQSLFAWCNFPTCKRLSTQIKELHAWLLIFL